MRTERSGPSGWRSNLAASARRARPGSSSRFSAGRSVKHNPNAFDVEGSDLGDFTIQLDTRFADYESHIEGLSRRGEGRVANLFGAAASLVVPLEIEAPPVTLHELPKIETLLNGLRKAGASGTEASPFFAFGLQFNPESPRRDARTITAILKAYGLASPLVLARNRSRSHAASVELCGAVSRRLCPVARAMRTTGPTWRS